MKFLKRIDLISILVISILSIVISVLDLFGLLPGFLRELNLDFSKLAVLLLSLIGVHLVVTYLFQERIDKNLDIGIEQIIKSVNGVEIRTFEDMHDLEQYLAEQISTATKEVCDLTWKNNVSLGFETTPRRASNKKINDNITKMSNKIVYKEIFVFNDISRIEKLKKRVQENRAGYSCRYYEADSKIPRIQFVIVDGIEMFFASSSYPHKCAIRHKELCEIFQAYFNQIWDNATPIKERSTINWNVYNRIIDTCDYRES